MFYKKYGELPKIGNEKQPIAVTSMASHKLECNLLKRITDEDEFNSSCDKECAETIAKSIPKEGINNSSLNKTLTPSQMDSTGSPSKQQNKTTNDSPQPPPSTCSLNSDQDNNSNTTQHNTSTNNINYKTSMTPVSSIQAESTCGSTCSSPDLSSDQQQHQQQQLIDEDLYQMAKPINFIFNKPLENIKPDSNAMFVRVWDRGFNSCCRTDVHFRYLPNAKYIRSLAEKKQQTKTTNGIQNNNHSIIQNNTNNSNTSNINNNNHTNGMNVNGHGPANNHLPEHPTNHVIPQPNFQPAQPAFPANFNFNFKEMFNSPEEL